MLWGAVQVVFPGAYRCVCVQLKIHHLAVNAVCQVSNVPAGNLDSESWAEAATLGSADRCLASISWEAGHDCQLSLHESEPDCTIWTAHKIIGVLWDAAMQLVQACLPKHTSANKSKS